jgi:rhodanese-related sulfurtransferase
MRGAQKAALFDGLAAAAKALANGRRAELVDVLAQGERSVDALAAEVDQSVANTSQHLQVLARAGLVGDLWSALRDVAAGHVAGIDRLAADYLGDRGDLEQVSRAELARRLEDGVVVWDVRPVAEYEAGHVPGAVSVPPDEVRRRLRGIPAGGEVVAYCRGPFCVYADDAVRLLRKSGRRARRLEGGFPEWRRAGLPVAIGIR